MSPIARAEPAFRDRAAARTIAVRLRVNMVVLLGGLGLAPVAGVRPLSARGPPPVLPKSWEISVEGFRKGFGRTGPVLGCEMPAERTLVQYEFGPFRLDAAR